MSTAHVLVVDDEPDIRELLSLSLERMGYRCTCAENVTTAKTALTQNDFQLCLTDMRLPDATGLDLIKFLSRYHSELPVAMMTAHGNIDTAVEALKSGAFDFISKPIELDKLRSLISNALPISKSDDEQRDGRPALIGDSPPMLRLRKIIHKLSRSQAPVFIHGESGTGKELVARTIHHEGSRRDKPFIPVNCGAISSELMESEFFGHKKGSFTGANTDKAGFFQAAEGGSLFLDEIAELPLPMQVKLLRAIQERSVRPVGSETEIPVDVRILSASHKHLQTEVDEGRFRQDLFFRINVIEVEVPPLRERQEDLGKLTDAILQKITANWNSPTISLADDAVQALRSFDFPGNVRELENVLERAITLSDGERITANDLQLRANHAAPASFETDLPRQIQHTEKQAIENALAAHQWNRTAAASALGMTLRQLRYRMTKMGIK